MDPNQPAGQNPRQQLIQRLQSATNVLVTVSANPSVDQLAALIGFTLLLNKLGKHATAVFSGKVPSTIEFLQPEETIRKDTDSLRDFIIALDKSKADKLRYKVEDQFVKIFITPYHASLSEKDLQFSQGDFNVEVIVAIGVKQQSDLDQAITAHGRILHDATVISISNRDRIELGTIHWVDTSASSLSEMMANLSDELQPNVIDAQMATAFLTGLVAETERFSNAKTAPSTMNLAARLMAAGANQQLVASKLEITAEPGPPPKPPASESKAAEAKAEPEAKSKADKSAEENEAKKKETDGSIQVSHDGAQDTEQETEISPNEIQIDEKGTIHKVEEPTEEPPAADSPKESTGSSSSLVLEPPTLGGKFNSQPERLDPSSDPLSNLPSEPILERPTPKRVHTSKHHKKHPAKSADPASDAQTLTDLEEAVHEPAPPPVDQARNRVEEAIAGAPDTQLLQPLQSLGAQDLPAAEPSSPPATPQPVAEPPPPEPPKPPTPQTDLPPAPPVPPPMPMLPPSPPPGTPPDNPFNNPGAPLPPVL